MPETNWKRLCIELAGEKCPDKRLLIVAEIDRRVAQEHHQERIEIMRDAVKHSHDAIERAKAAGEIAIEMRGMADDASVKLKRARERRRVGESSGRGKSSG